MIEIIEKIKDNALFIQISGAFAGAFFAFLLVICRDLYSNMIIKYRLKKNLIKVLKCNQQLNQDKIKRIKDLLLEFEKDNPLLPPASFNPYDINLMKEMEYQLINSFEINEKLALRTLHYNMFEIDKLLSETVNYIEELHKIIETSKPITTGYITWKTVPASNTEGYLYNKIKTNYSDCHKNTMILKELLIYYLEKDFEKITSTDIPMNEILKVDEKNDKNK